MIHNTHEYICTMKLREEIMQSDHSSTTQKVLPAPPQIATPVSTVSEADLNHTRFRTIFSLTCIGIIVIVLVFGGAAAALTFLSSSVAITIVVLAGAVVAVIGTLIGSQTGYLIGSSVKDHAERRADELQSALVKTIIEHSRGNNRQYPY